MILDLSLLFGDKSKIITDDPVPEHTLGSRAKFLGHFQTTGAIKARALEAPYFLAYVALARVGQR